MPLHYTQEADFRQQRDFGQKFSATFEFIGQHWRGLGRALMYIVLPAALLQGLVTGLVQKEYLLSGVHDAQLGRAPHSPIEQLAMLSTLGRSPYYWLNIALNGVFLILMVLTVYNYVACCVRGTSNEPITPGEVWAGVKRDFVGSYLSYFGVLLLVLCGFVFLLVPGIYLSVALSLFFAVKVMEGSGFTDTISRCLNLTRGKWWSTFGLLFVMSLALGIIMLIVGGVLGGLAFGLGKTVFSSVHVGSGLEVFTIVATTLGGLLNLLIYPPLLIAIGFQYFNLVERREGLGLRQMVNQLGQTPAAVANTAYRPDEEGEY